jgi:AcrR family transcriptional regulator
MGMAEKKRAKKLRLIKAATGLFAKKGFHLTTVDEITREAGVAKGTFYLYFKDKEELLKFIMQELWAQHKLVCDTLGNIACPRERLRQYITWELEFSAKNANFARLNLSALGAVDKSLIDWYLKIQREHVQFLAGVIAEGCAGGYFREMDATKAARFLRGAVFTFQANQVFKPHKQKNITQDIDFIFKMFLSGAQIRTTGE